MGLAERFKDRLAKRDIFTNNNKESYVSTPITQKIIAQPTTLISENSEISEIAAVVEPAKSLHEVPQVKGEQFEDLESEIIDKIRKTPYWEEYSTIRQEKMISSYFDKRITSEKYSYIKHSSKDKSSFIKNILALANNR